MPEKKSQITASSVTKTYGKRNNIFTALDSIDVSINKGESIAIIGKSGSGKSTLLHILACLDRPSTGSIQFENIETSKLKSKQLDKLRNQKFGFVFQQFFMNPNDNVLDNVALPLKVAGIRKKQRRERALEMLKEVELSDKAKSRARDLSGGQKQRVCIARALINNPEVIFADEPTGNLDTKTGQQIEKLLFDLNHEKHITLIVVTHDEDLANKCNRKIYLQDGRVVKELSKKWKV